MSYLERGRNSYRKGDYDAAIKDYDVAIRLNPKSGVEAFVKSRGCEFAKKAEWDRAIADFREAIRLDPKNAWAFYNRGYADSKVGWGKLSWTSMKQSSSIRNSPSPFTIVEKFGSKGQIRSRNGMAQADTAWKCY